MLLALGMKKIYQCEHREHYHVSLPLKRMELLDLAEKMSSIEETWLEQGYDLYKETIVLSVS